tara:strand:+ start:78 stop:422 length:345 start_codon:yes stop_codon:yes gene_type:complete
MAEDCPDCKLMNEDLKRAIEIRIEHIEELYGEEGLIIATELLNLKTITPTIKELIWCLPIGKRHEVLEMVSNAKDDITAWGGSWPEAEVQYDVIMEEIKKWMEESIRGKKVLEK